MSDPILKLVDPTAEPLDSIPLERRRDIRHQITGRATTLCDPAENESVSKKICALELVNISNTGLGAIAGEPLALGNLVTVLMPSHGPDAGFNADGQIMRCSKREFGYDIGIRFLTRAAA